MYLNLPIVYLVVSVSNWLTIEPNINTPKVLYISLHSRTGVNVSECFKIEVSTKQNIVPGKK